MVIFKNLKKAPKHDPKFDADNEVIDKPIGTMDGELMLEHVKNKSFALLWDKYGCFNNGQP